MVLLPVSKPFDNIYKNNIKFKILNVLEIHDCHVNFLSLSFLREAIIFLGALLFLNSSFQCSFFYNSIMQLYVKHYFFNNSVHSH